MFQDLKLLIVEQVGLGKDALHIYVALIVFLAACRVFHWRASSWKPWLVVLAAAILGEVLDMRHVLDLGEEIVADHHWTDLWNTMLAPTILVLAARYTPIFERPARQKIQSS